MVIIYFLILSIFSAVLYGYIFEVKVKNYPFGNPTEKISQKFIRGFGDFLYELSPEFWQWLFQTKIRTGFFYTGIYAVRYEILKWALKAVLIFPVIIAGSWTELVAIVLCHYFLLEYILYFNILGRECEVAKMIKAYPMIHINQAGFWLFRPFSMEKYYACYIISGVILLIAAILQTFKI